MNEIKLEDIIKFASGKDNIAIEELEKFLNEYKLKEENEENDSEINLNDTNEVEYTNPSDRSPRVGDMNFGVISSYGANMYEKPTLSEIEYDDENEILFNNFDELDKFLEDVFIPKYIHTKVRKSDIYGKQYQSIQLNAITKLCLSEDEVKHVFEYLNEQGIIVCGTAVMPEGEFINYDYYNTYKNSKLPDVLSNENQIDLFSKLKSDAVSNSSKKLIRHTLIERNVRLANYVLFKISKYKDIDIEEMKSNAYEGLIYAVDNFDVNLGYNFSTYAYKCIEGFVKRAIVKESGIPNYLYGDFQRAKIVVEKSLDKKYMSGDFEMLNEILSLMLNAGMITEAQKKLLIYFERENYMKKNYYEIGDVQDRITSDLEYDVSFFDVDELRNLINQALDTLTEREEKIIKLKYGLEDGKTHSLEEISKIFGVSKTRIFQIEAKALRKLRHPFRSKKLKGYLDDNTSFGENRVPTILDERGFKKR